MTDSKDPKKPNTAEPPAGTSADQSAAGDNRRAGDPDGNKKAGDMKTPGVKDDDTGSDQP